MLKKMWKVLAWRKVAVSIRYHSPSRTRTLICPNRIVNSDPPMRNPIKKMPMLT